MQNTEYVSYNLFTPSYAPAALSKLIFRAADPETSFWLFW